MKVISISCNECGAPIEAPKRAKFLTCDYCSARLKVVHSGGAFYSELIERMEERTEAIADDLEYIKRQNELERLDREWAKEQERYKVRHGDSGHTSIPTKAGSAIGAGLAGVFGIFWLIQASSMGAPSIFPLFGVVFVVAAVIAGVNGMKKADQYKRAKKKHRKRRREIYRKLRE